MQKNTKTRNRVLEKTLQSLRISQETHSNIEASIKKYNEKNLAKLSKQAFRRLAYELLSQIILQDKIEEIPVKLE